MYPANRLPARLCLVFILILPPVLFWRWLLRGEVLYWGTTLLQFWPWHHLVRESLLAGQWPLWNPLLGNGAPLLANLQSAVFYPLNLLYLLLPVEHGLTASVMLHLGLAGLFMYLYMRHLGLLPFAAALSALTYMFSGYIIGRTQFVVMVNAAAWLPLLLLLSDRLVRRRNPLDILGLALVLAVQLLAGHAQLWFYSLWLIGLYVIFRNWPIMKQGSRGAEEQRSKINSTQDARRKTFYPLLALFAAILLAVLLSAAQLLPTAEFTTQSPRSSGAERTFALTYSFWPWRLLTLLAPTFFGHPATSDYWGYANYWEDHAYLGVLPFLFALVAVWNYGMRKVWGPEPVTSDEPQPGHYWRVVPFFAVLTPLSLILAMGWNTPLYLWVFQFVPGFGFFQAPARLLIWFTVAIAVLAGVGAQSFKLTPASRRGWQRLLVAAAGLTIAGLAGNFILTGRSQTFLVATMTLGLWLILSAGLLLLRPRKTGSGGMQTSQVSAHHTRKVWIVDQEPLWQGAILVVVALDLLGAAWPLLPSLPASVFQQPIAAAERLKTQPGGYRFFVDDTFDYDTKFKQFFRFAGFGPADPTYWRSLKETLIPNVGVYADLPSSNNYDPLVVGRWQRLVSMLEETSDARRARLLALMNTGYFIGDASHRVGPTLVTSGTMVIQQVADPLPRAYFVSQATYAPDEAAAIARLTAPDFDYHREVIIMEGEVKAEAKAKAEAGQVTLVEDEAQQVSLRVEAPAAGFVVLTDTYYPGWQAMVDGEMVPIVPANLAFRAVAVEAGPHDIVFSYRPRSFTFGLWVSMLTLAGMVIMGILLLKRKRN